MEPNFKDLKVLIVDDQQLFREAVSFELEMLGCQTELAEDGKKGFECASQKKFDLVISDIRMPHWDGKHFLAEYRKVARSQPPFVFMTGFADITAEEAYDMGADGFLNKPLNPERLHHTLARLLTPLSSRLAQSPKDPPKRTIKYSWSSFKEASDAGQLQVGRGGFSVAATPDLTGIKLNENVAFDLTFASGSITQLNGQGAIAWIHMPENANAPVLYGVEIDFLEDNCRDSFLNYLAEQSPVQVIPFSRGPIKKM